MKYISLFVVAFASTVGGCADKYLDTQEAPFLSGVITPKSTLEVQSGYAFDLSEAYLAAGRSTANTQDIASFFVFLGAATAVSGAIGGAPDAAVANRAILAATVENAGRRTVPEKAIKAIYVGSKRLNCIGTMASVGVQLLNGAGDANVRAGRAVTYGAIREVMISTREGLTRDVADYSALITDFTNASKEASQTEGAQIRALTQGAVAPEPLDVALINKYLALLSNCVASGSQEKAQIEAATN